jgi:hypothetical protein
MKQKDKETRRRGDREIQCVVSSRLLVFLSYLVPYMLRSEIRLIYYVTGQSHQTPTSYGARGILP